MSSTDGYVVGATKIVDHGPDSARWVLVIVGDGYRATELTQYHTDVQNFLTTLRTTPPYTELFCGINVYRIDVVSTDSGADDPATCADGTTGSGATAATYFDATFCSVAPGGARLGRLLTINSALAKTVAQTQVSTIHQILCIVNVSKYGGSGGDVATCSTNSLSPKIAIHEMGHSAFGLADEYGGDGTAAPAGEPLEPNVTRDTNRATIKWGSLIAATTPLPSACDATCTSSACVPPATPPAPGSVGAYEGAIYSDCNTYRPLPSCYMRDYGPFCPVCSGVIRQTLAPFLPAESINLLTPSITFLNVPAGVGGVGVTTQRAIVFEVVTCRELHFTITAGPTGGFGVVSALPVTATADAILAAAQVRIWLLYTSTNPGDSANGSVTVKCTETGHSWTINIVANTIARPRAAVALVLDRSGSMNDDAGDATTKVQKLREATNAFISIMQAGDGIGLVRFNETSQRLMEVQDVGLASSGAGRTTAIAHIAGPELDPGGATSIGLGVIDGKQMLDDAQAAATPPYDLTAMIVLTDGQWNTPPPLSSVAGSITANTYAIGLGLPSNISVPALTTLCQGHNGFLLITGQLSPDQSMRLSKYFLQILAGVTNAQIAADPRGVLDTTTEHRIPFWICEADYGMDLIVLSPFPQIIDFQLEAPDGTRITPASGPAGANSQFVLSRYASYYRCALPVLPANATGSHEGLWYAILKLGHVPGTPTYQRLKEANPGYYDPKRAVLPYELVAQTFSSLTFDGFVSQNSYDIGAVVTLSAMLLEYSRALSSGAQVWAEIERPDKTLDFVSLAASGDQFTGSYELRWSGVYALHLRARGQTMRGTRFERERTFTATAVRGGDHWSPDDPQTHALCELLHCLREHGVLSAELIRKLRDSGVDLGALLKCLDKTCRSTASDLELRRPSAGRDASAGVVRDLQLEPLIELLATRLAQKLRE